MAKRSVSNDLTPPPEKHLCLEGKIVIICFQSTLIIPVMYTCTYCGVFSIKIICNIIISCGKFPLLSSKAYSSLFRPDSLFPCNFFCKACNQLLYGR